MYLSVSTSILFTREIISMIRII